MKVRAVRWLTLLSSIKLTAIPFCFERMAIYSFSSFDLRHLLLPCPHYWFQNQKPKKKVWLEIGQTYWEQQLIFSNNAMSISVTLKHIILKQLLLCFLWFSLLTRELYYLVLIKEKGLYNSLSTKSILQSILCL